MSSLTLTPKYTSFLWPSATVIKPACELERERERERERANISLFLTISRDCVSARDPYCVWDGDVDQCVSNPFSVAGSGTGTVDSARYKQNIHTGGSGECTGTILI